MGEIISRILKIISTIFSVLIGAVLIISLYAWMQIEVFKNSYASIFGYSIFNVVTGSMSGTIEIDDYVIVKETNQYKLNDIITFKYEDSLITHRIVEIKGNEFITKGDANNAKDYSVDKKNVVGKVVKIIPKAGIWRNVLTKPYVVGCIFVTLVLFAIFFSFEEKKYREIRHRGNLDLLRNQQLKKKVVTGKFDKLKK